MTAPLPKQNPRAFRLPPGAVLLPIVALTSAALLTACKGGGAAEQHQMPPPMVSVQEVKPADVPVTLEYTGQTAGSREVEIRARVTGNLLKRHYQEGAKVDSGSLLFTIDPAPFEAALAQAEASAASADAQYGKAQRDAARLKQLAGDKAISQKEFDDAVSGEQIALANVKAARAQVQTAKLNLGYTRVTAPISGLTGKAAHSEGALVSPGEAGLLTTVVQTDPIYVNFGFSDNDRLKLDRESGTGQLTLPADGKFAVKVVLSDGTTLSDQGKLDFTANLIDPGTGAQSARATLPNPKGVLKPGQFVKVQLSGATRPHAVVVPQRAVMEGPKGKFVYVVDAKNVANFRPVDVGDWSGTGWVINKGLNAGEKIITDGVVKVRPGAPVMVTPPGGMPGAPGGAPAGAGAPAKKA